MMIHNPKVGVQISRLIRSIPIFSRSHPYVGPARPFKNQWCWSAVSRIIHPEELGWRTRAYESPWTYLNFWRQVDARVGGGCCADSSPGGLPAAGGEGLIDEVPNDWCF